MVKKYSDTKIKNLENIVTEKDRFIKKLRTDFDELAKVALSDEKVETNANERIQTDKKKKKFC